MPRILYALLSNGFPQGGHKVAIRHVEVLRELGFDARCYVPKHLKIPTWLDHNAAIELQTPVQRDDIVVLPDDDPTALNDCLEKARRTIVFVQSMIGFTASKSFEIIDRFPPSNLPRFIAVSPGLQAMLQKAFPALTTELVPCFADERVFQPGMQKQRLIAYSPRKRPREAKAIRNLFSKLHSEYDLGWSEILNMHETQVADIFSRSELFLSLSKLESVGMTPLEAMACGCVCAGFNGIGGREFATKDNGFWVEEDDLEAAVDALAAAADLVQTGGRPLQHIIEAGMATAAQWSFANFRPLLEQAWMRLAPDTRRGVGLA